MIDKDQMKKALVCYVVEHALVKIGGESMLNVVNDDLKNRFNSSMADCYNNPQYLAEILKQMFGQSYNKIILTINEKLEEFSYQESIRRFLDEIKIKA